MRAGAPVTLRIAARDRKRAALDYRPPERRHTEQTVENRDAVVRVEPCDRDHPRFVDGKPVGEWTGYAGGFVLKRRACVTVFVERAGEAPLRRRISFGRRCGTARR